MPKFWVWLCRTWIRLSADQTSAWRYAMRRSNAKSAVTLRHLIWEQDRAPYPAQHDPGALSVAVEPVRLVRQLEDLWKEGALLAKEARGIETHILARMDAAGNWRAHDNDREKE